MSELCRVEHEGRVATILLNRPEKMNALGPELFESLARAVARVEQDDSVRVVILTGEGDHFSAGGDVHQDIDPLRDLGVKAFREYFEPIQAVYLSLYRLRKPTVAAIAGFAVGAGLELALVCDIRLAADDARLGEFFVRMGLVPEVGMCLLPKMVGPGMARLLCYTGRLVGAAEALRIGLVEAVVPRAELRTETLKLAQELACGPASIGLMKRGIAELGGLPLEATLDLATTYQFQATRTADHAAAVRAFLAKEKAEFTGE